MDPPVSRRRSSGSTVSRAWGPLAPAPSPGLGQRAYILPVSSVVWVTGREGQKCPALLVSPSMGAFSPDTRKPPGRPCSRCHHLVSPPPPASRTPAESLISQGVLGWKVGPSCKCCAHKPGCAQSNLGAPGPTPLGRELDAPTPAQEPLLTRCGWGACLLPVGLLRHTRAPHPRKLGLCSMYFVPPAKLRVTLKEDCLLPHVLFCLLRRERWELLFARCRMALGSPRAFHLLPCWGHRMCRTGREPQGLPPRSRNPPEGSQRTDVKRVRPASKRKSSLATATAQGGSPGRRQRFRSDTHELDFRGMCEPWCPQPRGPGAVFLRRNQPLPSLLHVRNCKPCAFGTAFCNFLYVVKGGKP